MVDFVAKEAVMEQPKQDMRSVKAAAKEQFRRVRGVEGIGIGDGTLRVYVRDAEVRERLPSRFRGVPVDCVVTGDISASGARG